MTPFVWSAFGMAVGAGVLHLALAFKRPLDPTHLSFACLMVFVAIYLVFEEQLYRAQTVGAAVEALRDQIIAAHGFVACILVFVPAYTHVRIPRAVMAACWVALASLFVANLVMPYGIWLAGPPRIYLSTFRNELYTSLVPSPLAWPQYVHLAFVLVVFVTTFACAFALVRRGDRQRGLTLAIALSLVVLQHLIDVVHDVVHGTWPYVAEYGLVNWGLIMSIQLALDFRAAEARLQATLRDVEAHAAELAETVVAALHVRDKLNTPLQTLELGLDLRTATTPEQQVMLPRLRRAVVDIAELGRAVERTARVASDDTAKERSP